MNNKKITVRDMAAVGIMAALVFVFTYFHIDIPTPLSNTMLHLGNVMSLLAALLFGGWRGGLAAGLGSMIYDMLDPRYIATCWITFILKFAMGWVAGSLAKSEGKKYGTIWHVLSGAAGSFTYVVLYVVKTFVMNYVVNGYELETVLTTCLTKGISSAANGVIAVVGAVALYLAMRPALEKAGIFKKEME